MMYRILAAAALLPLCGCVVQPTACQTAPGVWSPCLPAASYNHVDPYPPGYAPPYPSEPSQHVTVVVPRPYALPDSNYVPPEPSPRHQGWTSDYPHWDERDEGLPGPGWYSNMPGSGHDNR